MMNFLKQILLMLFFISGSIYAQNAVAASGKDITGTGGSVSYTIGQMTYTVLSGTEGTASQGVQQAFEISETLGVEDDLEINLTMIAFPNPTTDNLHLKIANFNSEELSYQLYDMLGRVITANKVNGTTTIIPMNALPIATYFLKVVKLNREIKVFRIIKK